MTSQWIHSLQTTEKIFIQDSSTLTPVFLLLLSNNCFQYYQAAHVCKKETNLVVFFFISMELARNV